MKALSIPPATASAILRHGQDILNRTSELPKKLLNEPIALHTSIGFPEDVADIRRRFGVRVEPLVSGCLVAVVKFTGCQRKSNSDWARQGFYHWEVEVIEILAFPVRETSGNGFWEISESAWQWILGDFRINGILSPEKKSP